MKRNIAFISLTAAGALFASSALACPYMKQDQVTQAPMSPIAIAEEAPQSAIATNDIMILPTTTETADDQVDE